MCRVCTCTAVRQRAVLATYAYYPVPIVGREAHGLLPGPSLDRLRWVFVRLGHQQPVHLQPYQPTEGALLFNRRGRTRHGHLSGERASGAFGKIDAVAYYVVTETYFLAIVGGLNVQRITPYYLCNPNKNFLFFLPLTGANVQHIYTSHCIGITQGKRNTSLCPHDK